MKDYKFDLPKNHKSIIKVIGVGGGGSNAVNHMFNQGIKDVEFVVVNTDAQALKSSPVPIRLQLGANLTEGLGAGANPERGRNAALESKEEIRELLSDNTKMVFITAGMGGGTGTGAAPVIAKIAKDLDILTVGIVTAPFMFEGRKKMTSAQLGIEALRENCDTVLVILNDKLREVYGNLAIRSAFAKADNVLTTAAKSIAEIITVHQDVNVDFEDVKTVMKDAGAAVMGSAIEEGEGRAIKAAEKAIASPLLNNVDIKGAQKILLSIMSGEEEELSMDELSEITEYIQERAGEEAEVIFGQGIDLELGKAIRVTVIATGFEMDSLKGAEKTIPNEAEKKIEVTEQTEDENVKKVIHLESGKTSKVEEEVPTHLGQTFTFPIQQPMIPTRAENNFKEETQRATQPIQNQIPTVPQVKEREEEAPFEFVTANAAESNPKVYRLEDEEPKAKAPETPNQVVNDSAAFNNEYYEQLKEKAIQRAHERFEKLRGLNSNSHHPEEFKDKLETPAYLRRQVKLNDVQHSSERSISRFNLSDDNEFLKNNRFLHDNVD
ncbi:cell division protein FtsZ [Belliella kenyensis]|uniref:Cell division protein FtsZ n=1 Tax=Belliella kenyensis TaxID=1472724 RepID=A0ABV8ENR6_9BACT|nr:cell division protein FtsZ [Belliella kenyensis]MCH7403839.1 cell division protein FtsZ [Belliella kenyensis]MDN3602449.1 cell division protein FtsZ [Belliella kenyensis]